MKRKFLLIGLLSFFILNNSIAQKIEVTKVFGGYKYTQNGHDLNLPQLVDLMASNPEALKYAKKAKTNDAWATIIAGAGGILVGYPIGTALGGGKPNWTMAGIGAGLIVVGIPLSSAVNKNAKKAVELYNRNITFINHQHKPKLSLLVNNLGFGLRINF